MTAVVGQGSLHRYPAAMSTYTCPKCGNVESIRPAAKRFYTIEDVMGMFEVSRGTVYNWRNAGDIKFVKIGNTVRIPAKSLKKYLATT